MLRMEYLTPMISFYRKSVKMDVKMNFVPTVNVRLDFAEPQENQINTRQNKRGFSPTKYNYDTQIGAKLSESEVWELIYWIENDNSKNLSFVHKINNNNFKTQLNFNRFMDQNGGGLLYSFSISRTTDDTTQPIERKIILSPQEIKRFVEFVKFNMNIGYLIKEIQRQWEYENGGSDSSKRDRRNNQNSQDFNSF